MDFKGTEPWVQNPVHLPQKNTSAIDFLVTKNMHAGEGNYKPESGTRRITAQICHKRHWPYKVYE